MMRAPIVIRGRPVDVEWARRELHPHGREPFASIHSLRSGKGNAKKRIRLDLNTIPIQRAERAALVVEEQTREADASASETAMAIAVGQSPVNNLRAIPNSSTAFRAKAHFMMMCQALVVSKFP
jgi:hypothetical protein